MVNEENKINEEYSSNEVHQNTPGKKNELDAILHLISLGFTKKKIREKLGISKTSLSNYLDKLEDMGCISREGKYKINLLSSSSKHPRVTLIPIDKKLNKRGHAFNFKILFPSEENLKEKPLVKEFLAKPSKIRKPTILPFGSIKFPYKRNTIWINKESLTIYTNSSYYSRNALHSKFRALQDIDNLVSNLKGKFGFRGVYGIEIFREHYGLIFNKFAEWLLSQNKKMRVKNLKNKSILWVDDSEEDDIGLKEFEADDPLRANKSDKLFEDHEKTNWNVTPTFTLKCFDNQNKNISILTKSQLNQSKQMEEFAIALNRHIPAYEGMAKFTEKLGIEVRELKTEIKSLKESNKNLRQVAKPKIIKSKGIPSYIN